MTDKFDLLILAELQQDARLPIPELAHRVGLSAPACYRTAAFAPCARRG